MSPITETVDERFTIHSSPVKVRDRRRDRGQRKIGGEHSCPCPSEARNAASTDPFPCPCLCHCRCRMKIHNVHEKAGSTVGAGRSKKEREVGGCMIEKDRVFARAEAVPVRKGKMTNSPRGREQKRTSGGCEGR